MAYQPASLEDSTNSWFKRELLSKDTAGRNGRHQMTISYFHIQSYTCSKEPAHPCSHSNAHACIHTHTREKETHRQRQTGRQTDNDDFQELRKDKNYSVPGLWGVCNYYGAEC